MSMTWPRGVHATCAALHAPRHPTRRDSSFLELFFLSCRRRHPPRDRRQVRHGCHLRPGLTQSDKISHIDMGDDRIDTVISHIISLISHIDIQDDHIDMIDNHIDTPYPKSIYYIPYRYSDRYLIEVRSPISISHIDLPIISCHSGSRSLFCSSLLCTHTVHTRRILLPVLATPLVPFSAQPDSLLTVYQCTRTHIDAIHGNAVHCQ